MSVSKVAPKEFVVENLGKPIDVRIYRRNENGVVDSTRSRYVGTLEAFWHNHDALVFKLKGLEPFIANWSAHYVEARI